MSDLIDMIAHDKVKLAAQREQNRRDFPLATAAMDSLNREFNDGMPPFNARVIYASENGKTVGRRE